MQKPSFYHLVHEKLSQLQPKYVVFPLFMTDFTEIHTRNSAVQSAYMCVYMLIFTTIIYNFSFLYIYMYINFFFFGYTI